MPSSRAQFMCPVYMPSSHCPVHVPSSHAELPCLVPMPSSHAKFTYQVHMPSSYAEFTCRSHAQFTCRVHAPSSHAEFTWCSLHRAVAPDVPHQTAWWRQQVVPELLTDAINFAEGIDCTSLGHAYLIMATPGHYRSPAPH